VCRTVRRGRKVPTKSRWKARFFEEEAGEVQTKTRGELFTLVAGGFRGAPVKVKRKEKEGYREIDIPSVKDKGG